ncbi:hypothetical protein HG537_0E02140 [Torulaspora globosa]|uniref:FZ domain-containing protein n=1 Tax=Torulaspora globosa TaxID=48254 RepID=A0A7H9HUA0_9SACH|nr:hypothetical protein HG537_0E02140 [Torulaspora sp. CBS 2947]
MWCWLVLLISLALGIESFDGFEAFPEVQNVTIKKDGSFDGVAGVKSGSNGIINPGNIYEWTPISANISSGERNVFVFTVDGNSTRLGIASTYEILIFLSGNICSQPRGIDKTLRVSYSFDESVQTNSSLGRYATFENGYMQALAVSPLRVSDANTTAKYSNLYVVVEPVNATTNTALSANPGDVWHYRLSISENDLVYQWDTRTWLNVLDTDHNSALLVTGNVTGDAQQFSNNSIYDTSLYDLYVYSFEESPKLDSSLNISLCAITNGPYIVSSVNSNNTGEIGHGLERTALAIEKTLTNRMYTYQEQFYVTGLNSSSTYVAYLTKRIGKKGNLSDVGGVLFSKQYFSTRGSDACSLIFGLPFCYGVAYSVPSPSKSPNNKTAIAATYDKIAESLYANFSKALQIIPCDTEMDARYSPIRTCRDCATSYRNWLCAVTIPRCTDTASEYYAFRKKDDNRNDYLNNEIQPIADYYEMLPCIDMCYAVARDCPSNFMFACPTVNNKIDAKFRSYNSLNLDDLLQAVQTCNFIGNATELFRELFD